MKNVTKLVSLVIAFVLLFSMSAFAAEGAEAGPDAQYAEHINVIIDNTSIAAINPIGAGGPGSATNWVYKMVYDTLVQFDETTGEYMPNLATSWETDDWQTIVFTLRDDIVFSNGEPFTADDVVFTIESALENPGSVSGGNYSSVASAEALDDYTVQITLNNPKPQFLYDCSAVLGGIMNREAVEADPERGVWIGTGAFKITGFGTNDFVDLERNDLYWGDPVPTQSMTLRYIPEMSTRLMMLTNGEADICFNLSEQDLDLVLSDPDHFNVFTYLANNCSNLGFNMNDPICGDLNFRMAVASALDRTEVALGAAGIYAEPETTGTFWGSETPNRNSDIPIIPYDLEKAKEYLAASPYNGEQIELITAIPTMINASTVIQNQLAAIGINVDIKQTDVASLMGICTYGSSDYQMYAFVGSFSYEPFSSMYGIYAPGMIQNRATYDNPEIQEILGKAAVEADPEALKDYCYQVQELSAADIPYLNLFYVKQAISAVNSIGGLGIASNGEHDLRFMYKLAE